ncbi:MAG: ankyrin repeat domain-containing protein [Alphaproteobacteria bacterium]
MTGRKKNFNSQAGNPGFLGQRLHRELCKPQPCFRRLRMLIEAGADLENRNKEGQTPLLAAVKRRHTGAALLLIESNASVSARDNDNRTPLYHAVNTTNIDVMRPLFAMNAPEGFITESLVGQDRWDDYIWSLKEKIEKIDAAAPIRLMKKLKVDESRIKRDESFTRLKVMKKMKLKR